MPIYTDNTTETCDFNSEVLAKQMLETLIGDKSFDIDDIEWDDSKITVPDDLMSKWKTDVDPVTIEELTSRKVRGSGVFDAIMESIRNHLKEEYDANRITGAEYASTYTKLTEAGLANAVQFTLQKNQAYFQGILAQAQAITAGIQAQISALTAKVQLAKTKAEALGVAAQYALTTMKLATEDAQHALVCKQQAVADAQKDQTEAQTVLLGEQAAGQHQDNLTKVHQTADAEAMAAYHSYQARLLNPSPTGDDATHQRNVDYLIKSKQLDTATYQAQANDPEATAGNGTNIDFLLKEAQRDNIEKNMEHIDNQMQVENKQRDLYVQQKQSYQYKSERDVADLYGNVYLAMKAVDEGLAIPKAFSGASINEVMQNLKVNVGLGDDSSNQTAQWIEDGVLKGTAAENNNVDAEEPSTNP